MSAPAISLHGVRKRFGTITAVDGLDALKKVSHGEFEVVLKNGARSRVSRTYRALLEKRLGQSP